MRAPNKTPALAQEWAVWSRTTWDLRLEFPNIGSRDFSVDAPTLCNSILIMFELRCSENFGTTLHCIVLNIHICFRDDLRAVVLRWAQLSGCDWEVHGHYMQVSDILGGHYLSGIHGESQSVLPTEGADVIQLCRGAPWRGPSVSVSGLHQRTDSVVSQVSMTSRVTSMGRGQEAW